MDGSFSVDVLLVTATTVETKAVLETFSKATGASFKVREEDGRIFFPLGSISGASVAMTQTGWARSVWAALCRRCRRVLTHFHRQPSSWLVLHLEWTRTSNQSRHFGGREPAS